MSTIDIDKQPLPVPAPSINYSTGGWGNTNLIPVSPSFDQPALPAGNIRNPLGDSPAQPIELDGEADTLESDSEYNP